jgi:catecholate siderophore receptor
VGTTLSPTVTQNGNTVANANLTTLNTPPEQSRNLEVGGKWALFEGKSLFGLALFHSEKYNERNTDVDSAVNQYLLSGKRHATGMEFNFAGRLSAAWEMFYNHTWIPSARIDISSATGNMKQGDRPGLTPEHSASLWSTYRVAPQWRVGGGVNYRGQQTPLLNANVRTQAFTTVDAMLEHTLSENTVIKLNVSNLTNKRYIDQVYSSFYIPGTPRRVELSLKTLF